MADKLMEPIAGLGNSELSKATATSSDVISGKTFYSGDKTLKTGTIRDQSNSIYTISTTQAPDKGVFFPQGNDIYVVPGQGYWGSWDHLKSRLTIPGPSLASSVGLTSDKLVIGNTILGISGSVRPLGYTYKTIWSSGDSAAFTNTLGQTVWYPYLSFSTDGIYPTLITTQIVGGSEFDGATDYWNYFIYGTSDWFVKSNVASMQWGTWCLLPVKNAGTNYMITITGYY